MLMTERHRYWCRSRDKPFGPWRRARGFPSPLLFLRRILFSNSWLTTRRTVLWYRYGARTSGRSPWLYIVKALELVGGAPGGRHRASPIHRRRARAALSAPQGLVVGPSLAVCKTLENAERLDRARLLPRFLDQLQPASRAEAQFLCIFDACDLTANNGARHAPIGHWIAFRVTRG